MTPPPLVGAGGPSPVEVTWTDRAAPAGRSVFRLAAWGTGAPVVGARPGGGPFRTRATGAVWPHVRHDATGPGGPGSGRDVHLRVDPDDPSEAAHAEWADVLAATVPLPPPAARLRATALLRHRPGCLVVAVPDGANGCVCALRSGVVVRLAEPGRPRSPAPGWCAALASFLHTWLVRGGTGRELAAVEVTTAGARNSRLALTTC